VFLGHKMQFVVRRKKGCLPTNTVLEFGCNQSHLMFAGPGIFILEECRSRENQWAELHGAMGLPY